MAAASAPDCAAAGIRARSDQDCARRLPGVGTGGHAGDIDGSVPPQVELGAYQVQIGTPASLTADFTIHS